MTPARPSLRRSALLSLALLIAAPGQSETLTAVGRVNRAGYADREMCSGALVRADLVLTAAHCVADPVTGAALPLRDLIFVAGYSPEGHAGAARAAAVTLHPRAFDTGSLDLRYDIALIALTTPLDIPPLPTGRAAKGPLDVIGYRRSAPHRQSQSTGCAATRTEGLWRLDCAVEKGQSGGPVLHRGRIVGVISAGRGDQSFAPALDRWVRAAVARPIASSVGQP